MNMEECSRNFPKLHYALKQETEQALEDSRKYDAVLEEYRQAITKLEAFQNIPEVVEALNVLKSLPWLRP